MSKNAFLEDLVQVYAEEAEVDTLKTLREMDSNWNDLSIKVLEKRSVENQLEQLVFSKEEFQEDLSRFLENTGGNPQLFHSFRFKFPESFNFIKSSFFNIYKPMYILLEMMKDLKFKDHVAQYLVNFFSLIAPTLEELEIKRNGLFSKSVPQQVPSFILPPHSGHQVFPKLTTLTLQVKKDDNFQFILDKSGAIDPSPNLTSLYLYIQYRTDLVNLIGPLNSTALSRWSQLINLTINYDYEMDDRLADTLVSMSQAGMSLKKLILITCPTVWMPSEKMNDFLLKFFNFLEIQSKSLQVLDLWCIFWPDDHATEEIMRPQIKIPIFENVHTLALVLCYIDLTLEIDVHRRLFEMGPLLVHFPKLEHLEMYKQDILVIFPSDVDALEPIPLKSLHIHIQSGLDDFDEWSPKFTSVEVLKCDGNLLELEKPEVPWKESLKVLEIENFAGAMKVSHLTNLRTLIVDFPYFDQNPEYYFDYFDQVLTLKLSEIIFKTCEADKPSDEVKAQYIKHFFPIPVNFQLKNEDYDY